MRDSHAIAIAGTLRAAIRKELGREPVQNSTKQNGTLCVLKVGDDVTRRSRLLSSELGPACFTTPLPVEPAWKTIPSCYVLREKNRTVHPEGQHALAKKIGVTVISIPASHAATVSRPDAVAEAITHAVARR